MKTPAKQGMSLERLERIAPAIQQHLGDEKIAGAITLLCRRDEVVHFQCHGLMDRERSLPMRPDAIFRIFSMTKPITVVALLTLLEKGLIRLNHPASRFLPAFDDLKVIKINNDGASNYVELSRPVTLRDLLTHTSGLFYHYHEHGPVEQIYRDRKVFSVKPLRRFIDDLLELPLALQPGTKWRYSAGLDVIARIVEIVSGISFGAYLEETIIEPLGMVDTDFFVPENKIDRYCAEYGFGDVVDPDMTTTRWWGDEGRLKPHLIRTPDQGLESKPHKIHRGCHGLVSTAGDYLRFCRMLLNGGELEGVQILGRKTIELMTTNHLTENQLPVELLGPGWGFGLGVRVLTDLGQAQILGSPGEHGWGGAAGTYYWIDPKEELIGIYMIQFQPGGYHMSSIDFRTAAYQAIL